jgi:hypothetical protein
MAGRIQTAPDTKPFRPVQARYGRHRTVADECLPPCYLGKPQPTSLGPTRRSP